MRRVWRQRAAEFQAFAVQAAGRACLLTAVSDMTVDGVRPREILEPGPHTTNVFLRGENSRIAGVVPYGKPGLARPALPVPPTLRLTSGPHKGILAAQLGLFASAKQRWPRIRCRFGATALQPLFEEMWKLGRSKI
ncbi:hypothetical protein MKL09_24780 [Methylobacterium sp. J-048]|uniref:hypothetical protein n=1 Tax=Methylobacterium sp. J-048 TaxID=2836635 RepID=UPI001FB86276|nr:hypothetical protein [Methylobacterium sp. J-048]MCJ2059734.1 hypothetical protein [Methylobacterium sp. J-048]